MKRLAVITYNVNSEDMTLLCAKYAKDNANQDLTEIIVIDNGSTPAYPAEEWIGQGFVDRVIRYDTNQGANCMMHRWMPEQDNWFPDGVPDVLLFIHAGVFIREPGYDKRILDAFDSDPRLGLAGFIGSNEIDERGGRGGGTKMNWMGDFYPGVGQCSTSNPHGRKTPLVEPAAVLDHASLAFRTSLLPSLIKQEAPPGMGHPPEHFMDRAWSCNVMELGYRVKYIGILHDHASGGIRGGCVEADVLRRKWFAHEGIPVDEKLGTSMQMYIESEKRFFSRYRDTNFFPCKIDNNYKLTHWKQVNGQWRPYKETQL